MINLGTNLSGAPVQLKSNALTTHTAVVGMTGSGKTGLLLGMAEELAQNKTPLILVDIKGDMLNFALQPTKNPDLKINCLTPGGTHGEPVNVFADLAHKEKFTLAATSLLRMVGDDPDPLKSKPHAFISTILQKRHTQGKTCQLIDVIRAVQDPGFDHLGAMELDFAFPKRSRIALAGKLNNLLVAPSFQPWREGVDLDLDLLMDGSDGRVPVLVYSVAHLANADEQNFALSLLFEEVLRWAKRQPGSSRLQTSMIVDECVGLLPPHPANPPTKTPLLLMLKQLRAFGVGVTLATQNPVDIDYKAMGNCGTWMVGRLSMDKDRQRLIKGVCANAPVTQGVMESRIAGLKSRQFVMVRPEGTTVFKTRDVTCNLQGPMSPEEIEALYTQGILEPADEEAVLRQKLHLARKELSLQRSPEAVSQVAELEQKLNLFNSMSGLVVIQGGNK